jgi:phosphate transport system protein
MDTNEQVAGTVHAARSGFARHLADVEAQVLGMGDTARRMLVDAGIVLQTLDAGRAHAIVAADDEVDAAYLEVERSIVELIATQQPVAIDLRRLIALLQASLHLERIADSAVDVARLVLGAEGPKPGLVADLTAMDTTVRLMLDTALQALRERRTDLCLAVVRMGDQLDDGHGSILATLAVAGSEGTSLPRLLWVDRAARLLERAGEHVIDIAEAVWFQVTGELREFDRDGRDRVGTGTDGRP